MKRIHEMSKQEVKDRFDLWRSNIARDLKRKAVDPNASKEDRNQCQKTLESLFPSMIEANPFEYPDFVKTLENDGN